MIAWLSGPPVISDEQLGLDNVIRHGIPGPLLGASGPQVVGFGSLCFLGERFSQ